MKLRNRILSWPDKEGIWIVKSSWKLELMMSLLTDPNKISSEPESDYMVFSYSEENRVYFQPSDLEGCQFVEIDPKSFVNTVNKSIKS